jgi:hypothetical protein
MHCIPYDVIYISVYIKNLRKIFVQSLNIYKSNISKLFLWMKKGGYVKQACLLSKAYTY